MFTKLEVYRDRANYYRWRLKASNGEIVATSEAYATAYGAKRSAQHVKAWAAHATIVSLV